MAYRRDDEDVDDFDDYDPTPYGGGYDTALTYGRPIDPCDELCYPISSTSDPFTESKAMEAPREQNKNRKTSSRHYAAKISFSASLPDDVQGAYSDSICAVKHSVDPFEDLRESILEMIEDVGVHSWDEIEENSSEIHGFIVDAFLSLCCT